MPEINYYAELRKDNRLFVINRDGSLTPWWRLETNACVNEEEAKALIEKFYPNEPNTKVIEVSIG